MSHLFPHNQLHSSTVNLNISQEHHNRTFSAANNSVNIPQTENEAQSIKFIEQLLIDAEKEEKNKTRPTNNTPPISNNLLDPNNPNQNRPSSFTKGLQPTYDFKHFKAFSDDFSQNGSHIWKSSPRGQSFLSGIHKTQKSPRTKENMDTVEENLKYEAEDPQS